MGRAVSSKSPTYQRARRLTTKVHDEAAEARQRWDTRNSYWAQCSRVLVWYCFQTAQKSAALTAQVLAGDFDPDLELLFLHAVPPAPVTDATPFPDLGDWDESELAARPMGLASLRLLFIDHDVGGAAAEVADLWQKHSGDWTERCRASLRATWSTVVELLTIPDPRQ